MKRFQYKVEKEDPANGGYLYEHDLNMLGAQGWELMFVSRANHENKTFYFKREIERKKIKIDSV